MLTAGSGTRLRPVTQWVNKCILPVGKWPMIYYPIWTLVGSGLKDVIIITGPPYGNQVEKVVSNLKFERVRIRFARQNRPLGFSDAIASAEKLAGKSPIMVVGGDTIHGGVYTKYLENFKAGAIAFLRKVDDPKRFGVPIYDKKGKLVDIKEKPKKYEGKLAICGPLIFDHQVFTAIKAQNLSSRGEKEIVDVYKYYLKSDKLRLIKAYDFHQDVGTPESLADASGKIIHHEVRFDHGYL